MIMLSLTCATHVIEFKIAHCVTINVWARLEHERVFVVIMMRFCKICVEISSGEPTRIFI